MVKRKAAKGANIGKEFYGCSRYPKCRGIVNIK
jgi:restriction system protein